MRRTEQAFKAEVFRRSENFKKKRKKRIMKLVASLGCFALLILALPMLPLSMGGSAEAADSAVFDSFYGNGMLEAPAAEQKSESISIGATGAAPQDAEPEEYMQPEDGAVYEVRVWRIHPDGTEEEWIIRNAERIRDMLNALQAFEDLPLTESKLKAISEEEGHLVYILSFISNDERHTYELYADHGALWYAFDGGYWVGQGDRAAKELIDALQTE